MTRSLSIRDGIDGFVAQAEAFVRGAEGHGPPWLHKARREALAAFDAAGFPGPQDEEWRYTNLAALARTAFERPGGVSVRARTDALGLDPKLGPIGFGERKHNQLVLVNGRFDEAWSNLSLLPRGVQAAGLGALLAREPQVVQPFLGQSTPVDGNSLVALNAALLEDGAFLHVPKGVAVAEPVYVIHLSVPDGPVALMAHPRTVLVLDEGSQASVVEVFLGTAHAGFTNAVTEILLQPGAVLDHTKVQDEGPGTHHIGSVFVRQAASSQSRSHVFSFGADLARNEISVLLNGEGAGTVLNGLFCATGSQHVDNHSVIDHARPRCTSQEFYKGILDGEARGAFDGRIVVRAGAEKTDAHQKNRNLILSSRALVESKPQLEIYNNDVRCTHGSTTGQLDDKALFYLRSRGLGEPDARALLTFAFGRELVEKVTADDVFAFVEGRLLTWLSRDGLRPEAP